MHLDSGAVGDVGCLPLASQQRFLGRTKRVETPTQSGNPQIDVPLPLIPEAPGGHEPVLAAHAVHQRVISD